MLAVQSLPVHRDPCFESRVPSDSWHRSPLPSFVTVVLSTSPTATGAARDLQLLLAALALVAGMTSMALACWSYVGWRLNRIARALEDTLDADLPVQLRESGIPAERRLARAFNAAAGAFLQVEARATHDRMTGVANRETLLTTLVAEVERAARHHSWLSVAFIDIDRFKPINDTYGHNSGDAVLRQVASLIADNIRASDLFGRYGGEEFMLILPETQQDEAVVLAEKLRTLVAHHRLVIAGNQHVQATISIGVAGDIGSQLQVDALVDQADAAMYAAKSLGRNRTYLFRAVDESCAGPSGADLGRTIGPRPPPSGAGPATPPRRRWHRSWLRSRITGDGRRT